MKRTTILMAAFLCPLRPAGRGVGGAAPMILWGQAYGTIS